MNTILELAKVPLKAARLAAGWLYKRMARAGWREAVKRGGK